MIGEKWGFYQSGVNKNNGANSDGLTNATEATSAAVL